MTKIENKLVRKVIDAMVMHNSTEYFESMNCFVLDMAKGFLFYNDKTGCLYHGFSKVEMPSYLSSETQRSPSTINYTIGFDKHQLKVCRLRNEGDFNKLYDNIIDCS